MQGWGHGVWMVEQLGHSGEVEETAPVLFSPIGIHSIGQSLPGVSFRLHHGFSIYESRGRG